MILSGNNIMASLEAMLFAAGDPVEPGKLAEVLDVDVENVIKMLGHLEAMYDENNRGLRLIRIDGKYQLCTREEYSDEVRGLLEIKKNTPLSQAAFEVLAIVAYNKTVTRSFIEQIRGVDCSGPVSNLIQKGLLRKRAGLIYPEDLLYTVRRTDFCAAFLLTASMICRIYLRRKSRTILKPRFLRMKRAKNLISLMQKVLKRGLNNESISYNCCCFGSNHYCNSISFGYRHSCL